MHAGSVTESRLGESKEANAVTTTLIVNLNVRESVGRAPLNDDFFFLLICGCWVVVLETDVLVVRADIAFDQALYNPRGRHNWNLQLLRLLHGPRWTPLIRDYHTSIFELHPLDVFCKMSLR